MLSRSVIVGLFVITLFLLVSGDVIGLGVITHGAESRDEASRLFEMTPKIEVTLSAAHWTLSWDDRVPEQPKFDLPLLYLHHERGAATEADRTLAINISGLAAGTDIEIEVVSRHVDVSTGDEHHNARSFVLPDHACTLGNPCSARWTFDATTMLSDFYYVRVKDAEDQLLWQNPHPDRPDFMMLDTWDVGLGGYTMRVYYATLFPFARGPNDLNNRLAPEAVADFVEQQFVPIIISTWNTQFHTWGFGDSIQPDWDSDKVVEVIITDPTFALFDGIGTCTRLTDGDGRPYPERRIWWSSSAKSFQAYDSLESGYKVVFAHEFFHLVQWNLVLSRGRPTNVWPRVFLEAQGRFASSVQHPGIEIGYDHIVGVDSGYARAANRFLALRLNTAYRDLETDGYSMYDAALYWRFLYEQFDDMDIIGAALEEMTVHYEPDDIAASMRNAMNSTFARVDGPFRTFEDSLIAFARANYALGLENGRCAAADPAECDGRYYDPNNVYMDPPVAAEFNYDGALMIYDGSIPSSFGMDFAEVRLDLALLNQPMTIRFQGEGTIARFSVQIWKLGSGGEKARAITPYPETIPQNDGQTHVYSIPRLDTMAYDRLALIITRLDPDETTDPAGKYRITIGFPRGTARDGIAG